MSNIFTFTGTIGRDAEVRAIPSGTSVLNVTVANNIGYGNKQKTLWIQVALFGKRAEGTLVQYLVKGQQVFCSGELTQEEYQANDGTMKTSLRLNANVLDLVGKKSDNQQGQYTQQQPIQQNTQQPVQQQQPWQQQTGQQPQQQNNVGFDGDVPF